MKNIPEINPCIPNPEARWCPGCKAHTGFNWISSGESGSDVCKGCEKPVITLASEEFFKNGSLGCTIVFLIAGLFLCLEGSSRRDPIGLLGFIFSGFVLWFFAFMLIVIWLVADGKSRKFARWRVLQEGKTESELEQEGLEHSFQAECQPVEDLYEWASQFFDCDSEEWEQFKAKYDQGEKSVEEKSKEVDPSAEAPPPVDRLED